MIIATNVLCLSNMVNPDTIEDEAEYEDVYNDIKDQIISFGQIRSMIIPRKNEGFDERIVGKVSLRL